MVASAVMPDALQEALKGRKLASARAAVKANPEAARHPKYANCAAQAVFLPGLELLHRNGADLNGSYRNYRPLHNVIQAEPHAVSDSKDDAARIECLNWLLEHGADPEQLGAWPAARAVIIAAFGGKPEFVKILRAHGAVIDGFAAAALGDLKLLEKTLCADPAFVHARDHGVLTALQCAAGSRIPRAKLIEAATMLIDAGADIAAKTKSYAHEVDAIYFAASAKNLPMFQLLLDHGADPTSALTPALWNGTLEFAALAFDRGAQPDRATTERKPLLNHLICWGQISQTMWLLDRGASPNVPDPDAGWTATHQAASRGNARMMRAVLDAGGDIARRDKKGYTPRDIARLAGRGKLVEMMSANQ